MVISFTCVWEGGVGAKLLRVILHWIIVAPPPQKKKVNQMSTYARNTRDKKSLAPGVRTPEWMDTEVWKSNGKNYRWHTRSEFR
jgi:hypothetical protein